MARVSRPSFGRIEGLETLATMRVVTLNVRNPSFDDGPNPWEAKRRRELHRLLVTLRPSVLCLQEMLLAELTEVEAALPFGPIWSEYGDPRDDGIEEGEMCAIVRFGEGPTRPHGTEWLGETPDVPGSTGWDAMCPRVVTWVDFGEWAVLNTHLDHVGLEARRNGMAQVIRRADALDKPCLIVGDLNATPDEPPLDLARAAGFVDLADGTGPTFHGFGKEPEIRIDYVLARGPWRCERAWVERGDYSDHWAVVVDLELDVA